MTGKVLAVWVITCLIWSTVWLFIKLGVQDVPPVTFGAFRLALALAVLLPIVFVRRTPWPRTGREWRLVTSTGVVLLGINYALLNWGIQYISSGLTAVLQAITPVFGFVFAHLLLHDEKMTALKAGALGLGIAGVGIIFLDQLEAAGTRGLLGSAAVVGGAMCVAIAYVQMRRSGAHLHPSAITSGQMLSALPLLTAYALAVEGNPLAVEWSVTAAVSVLYLALLGSVTGAWLNYWLLKRIGATRLLVMGLVEPLIAVIIGAAFLGESMNVRTVVGGVCILIGVALVLDIFGKRL